MGTSAIGRYVHQGEEIGARRLSGPDASAALATAGLDEFQNIFLIEYLTRYGCTSGWPEIWGFFHCGKLDSISLFGNAVVLTRASDAAVTAFADRALELGPRFKAISGPRHTVENFWELLSESWRPPRIVAPQLVMKTNMLPDAGAADASTPKLVTRKQVDAVFPAYRAAREELGDRIEADDCWMIRLSLLGMIERGRLFAAFEGRRVIFLACIANATQQSCRLSDIWLSPAIRGKGRSRFYIATVVRYALSHVAPNVTLEVDEANKPALAVYQKLGFQMIDTALLVHM